MRGKYYDPQHEPKKVRGLDLTGHKYGRLYVIRDSGERCNGNKMWLCCCECGVITTLPGCKLRSGNTTSCGCALKESRAARKGKASDRSSLVGNVYGDLTVLKDSGKRTSGRVIIYTCQCNCGNLTEVPSGDLKRKTRPTTSCGCVSVTHGESGHPLIHKAISANRRAKELGLDESILPSQIESLFDQHGWSCFYCGLQSIDHEVMTLDHFIPFANGGSNTIQNCVPACSACNSSKRDRDPKEFIESKRNGKKS